MSTTEFRVTESQKNIDKVRAIEKTLPIACSDFFRSIANTTTPLTRLSYAYDFKLFFKYLTQEKFEFADVEIQHIGDVHLQMITRRDIEGYQDFLAQYSLTDESNNKIKIIQNREYGIMRKLSSLRSLFEYLFQTEHIVANVATRVSLPKIRSKVITLLNQEEMQRLIDTIQSGNGLTAHEKKLNRLTGARDLAMIMLFLGTGIRVSECVGINLDDIDFSVNGILITRKGGNETIIYFPEQVATSLEHYIEERKKIEPVQGHEQALFLSLQRRRITQRAVENLVKKYARVVVPFKKKMSPHKLRSTFGTNLYHETGDINLVAEILGHSDVNTTRRHYVALSEQRKKLATKHVVLPQTDIDVKGED